MAPGCNYTLIFQRGGDRSCSELVGRGGGGGALLDILITLILADLIRGNLLCRRVSRRLPLKDDALNLF